MWKPCKNNKFKISALPWNEEFELPDGPCYVSDVQDYIKLKREKTNNPWIGIYINKVENKNTFKIKAGYYIELLTPETMKLLGSNKIKIAKNEDGETLPHLEITEVVLVHSNIVNNNYQQNSRVLYTFVPHKPFG